MKLKPSSRNWRRWRSLDWKFLNRDASVLKNFGPKPSGSMIAPLLPAVGRAKQFGFRNWFAPRPLVGSQVSTGIAGTDLVPVMFSAVTPLGSVRLKLLLVLFSCRGAPLCSGITPETCQSLMNAPANLLLLTGLPSCTEYAALKIWRRSKFS